MALRHLIPPLFAALCLLGCGGESSQTAAPAGDDAPSSPRGGERSVVVYTALDREFSEPIFRDFTAETGIRVDPVYDTEAVKTVGLVNRILAEKDRPRADVFWNNEIVRSIQLQREGVTQPYHSPSAKDIPATFKDPDGHWTGFAARARVTMARTDQDLPKEIWASIGGLTDPAFQGRAAVAKPLFGTTNTHAAVTWALMGAEPAREFWRRALENSVMVAGNAQARDAAADGEVAYCWTDTDDAHGALLDGKPVQIVFADALPDREGVLLIPNTVVLLANAPHPDEGKALIDYLLSPEVEEKLAASRSAQMPVRPGLKGPEGLPPLPAERVLAVDWSAVADVLAEANEALVALVAEVEAEQ